MTDKDFIDNAEIYSVLSQYNPWWHSNSMEVPSVRRTVFQEIKLWVLNPPTNRAVVINGARQVGKTTLIHQLIYDLIHKHGTNPNAILYVTFDHPIFKLIGTDKTIEVWNTIKQSSSVEYVFFDEIQFTKDWQIWLKHQVDFYKNRRITVTGSAIPIEDASTESGVGRWHTIKVSTLSFFEFLRIRNVSIPAIPALTSFLELFKLSEGQTLQIMGAVESLIPHFNDYLLKGGFPQIANIEDVSLAQQLVREDIIDKVLKRDMTSIFGVRHVLELEKVFLYLCLHDGGIFEINSIASALGISKQTVVNFINILESAHLLYKLRQFGDGKGVLKGRPKLYLADPAISSSVLLIGKALLEDRIKLGITVESAFIKHAFSSLSRAASGFYYWKGRNQHEVDLICKIGETLNAFEVKHSASYVTKDALKGLLEFAARFNLKRAYVITGTHKDFGVIELGSKATIFRIPAALACYWLGQHEDEIVGRDYF